MRITAEDANQETQASAKCIVDVTPGICSRTCIRERSNDVISYALPAAAASAYYLDAMTDLIG